MKTRILSLLALGGICLTANAQQYVITGTAPEGVKEISFRNMEQRDAQTIAVAEDGTFRIEGDAQGKMFAQIQAGEAMAAAFLEGNLTVDWAKQAALGTEENALYAEWCARLEEKMKESQRIAMEYNTLKQQGEVAKAVEDSLQKAFFSAQDEMVAVAWDCCQQCRDKRFPAIFLAMLYTGFDREALDRLVDENPAYMEVNIAQRVKQEVLTARVRRAGNECIDVALADTLGTEHHLKDLVGGGKYVLVDFWASWCGPCRAEMPEVKALYEKYHAKGFDIVGVSLDSDKAAWTACIRKMELPWQHISDLKGWQSAAAEAYGIRSIPHTILFGPDGKIVEDGLRAEGLAKKLQEIYGE